LSNAAYQRAYYQANKEKIAKRNKEWNLANPGKRKQTKRADHLKRTYGLTSEDFNSLLTQQNNRCAVCNTDTPTQRGWHVDHCHTTGDIRGILCGPCNTGMGSFKDDPSILKNAITYLSRSA
jgi:hypothetical protein